MSDALGFIGPCRGDVAALRPLAELLLFELGARRVIYLGADDGLERASAGWAERLGAPPTEDAFLAETAMLAADAPAEVLEGLLERDRRLRRLADLGTLPPPPARAVEMFDDRVVLMVFDKAVLDEDDVANATVIVWGNAAEAQLRAIGPRVFLTPGWVSAAAGPQVAVIEHLDAALRCTLRDRHGKVTSEHRASLVRAGRVGVL